MKSNLGNTMPVTESVARQIGQKGLSGLTIIHINHLLRDVLDLSEVFVGLGADLVYVPVIYGQRELPVGLPYPSVYACREGDRFSIQRDSQWVGQASADFEGAVKAAVREAFVLGFRQASSKGNKKVLVVEDGGYHVDVLSGLCNEEPDAPRIIGAIEQTKAGVRSAMRYIEADGRAPYPILSIARSKLKVRFENYFVARRVVEETALLLYELEDFLAFRDVLLIGYGIIGRSMAHLLRKLDCRVIVMDSDPQVKHTAMSEGFETADTVSREMFETNPIVLGATGHPAFTLNMFIEFLKSPSDTLYLVSASSKRVEFLPIIRYFEGSREVQASLHQRYLVLGSIQDVRMTKSSAGLEYSFTYKGHARRIVLLAEGYPVNFYRPDSQSLPSRVMDPINAEILLLVQYLFRNHSALRGTLYLLGHHHLPDLHAEEDELMALWMQNNDISPTVINSGIWQVLSPHPNERWLATHG